MAKQLCFNEVKREYILPESLWLRELLMLVLTSVVSKQSVTQAYLVVIGKKRYKTHKIWLDFYSNLYPGLCHNISIFWGDSSTMTGVFCFVFFVSSCLRRLHHQAKRIDHQPRVAKGISSEQELHLAARRSHAVSHHSALWRLRDWGQWCER